ncbi:SLATT domain-containing protein [Dactylosporangium sp. NPDC000521]|uniref:SLATT domain-containing protein n=1 Tax=Dactylosporangium sp. NPDC000521 TaxID=3363975 RepID=UPI0036797CEC
MTDRESQFRDLYERHRVQEQQRFLEQRRDEFRNAYKQGVRLRNGLLVLSGVVGATAQVFSGPGSATARGVCGLVAALIAALAGAVAGYSSLMGFASLRRSYEDALKGVRSAGHSWRDAPDDPAAVLRVEEVLRTENGHWGQLVLRQADGTTTPGVER